MPDILAQDLDAALERTRDLWSELTGCRLLLTGATGFIGTLLLESVAHARARAGVDVGVVALVRNLDRLHVRRPWTRTAAWLEIVQGDARSFAVPAGTLDLAIHAASTGSPAELAADPAGIAHLVVEGSRHVRDVAGAAGARRLLHLSSGSVYGPHHAPAPPIVEEDQGQPQGSDRASRLARAKREAEQALLAPGASDALDIVIARGFALCGPWLPTDYAFAFGNFVGAAVRGEPIRVSGDGTPVRSYLYASDLIVWLWTLLLRGRHARPYNVGSEHPISIGDLARRVAAQCGGAVEMGASPVSGTAADWYVPSTARARTELGLRETVPIGPAIARTVRWWTEHEPRSSFRATGVDKP